jgi:hypothetical protein
MNHYQIRINGVENSITAEHHLMQGQTYGLGLRSKAVPERKTSQRFNLFENPITPSTSSFGSIFRIDIFYDLIDLIVRPMGNSDFMLHTSQSVLGAHHRAIWFVRQRPGLG